MKLKTLVFLTCFSLLSSVYAENQSLSHSNTTNLNAKGMKIYGCEIAIINDSYDDIVVYGEFNDGYPLKPTVVSSFGYPLYINLYRPDYYGYYRCNEGMRIYIDNYYTGYNIYEGYSYVNEPLHIVPSYFGFGKKAKVEVKKS